MVSYKGFQNIPDVPERTEKVGPYSFVWPDDDFDCTTIQKMQQSDEHQVIFNDAQEEARLLATQPSRINAALN